MISLYKSSGALRTPEVEDDIDPMSSVANIADAMLVFACGLMVALVVAWEVDLSAVKEVELQDSEQIEDVQTLQDILSAEGSAYIQRGTVYQDPNTGTMYLLEDTAAQGGSAAGTDGEAADGATGSGNNATDAAGEAS